jgi:hypothetical protein
MGWHFWRVFAASVIFLAGCGGGDKPVREAERLAKDITRNAKGAVSVRAKDIEGNDLLFSERKHNTAVIPPNRASDNPNENWRIELNKWACAPDRQGPIALKRDCKSGGVPISYTIAPKYIAPGSIQITSGDADTGEMGFAVAFKCAEGSWRCITRAILTKTNSYESCKTRTCDAGDAELEADIRSSARAYAELGEQTIECKSEKTCDRVAEDLRKLASIASGYRHISSLGEAQKIISQINDAVVGAEFIESPGSYAAGYALGVGKTVRFKTRPIAIDPNGSLHLELRICPESLIECQESDDEWVTKITHIALADINPPYTRVDNTKSAAPRNSDKGKLVLAYCRGAQQSCMENEGNPDVKGLQIFIPCPDGKCEKAARDFQALAAFSSSSIFEEWRSKQAAHVNGASDITSRREAERALERIAKNMNIRSV